MSYEDAPQTKILATHCAACGRPLCDAVSVEAGMGPDCRKRLIPAIPSLDLARGDTASQWEFIEKLKAERDEANQIVYQIALAVSTLKGTEMDQVGRGFVAAHLARLRELAFTKLADKLEEAWVQIKVVEEGGYLYLYAPYMEESLGAYRAIPGRWWDRNLQANRFPLHSKPYVWSLLKRFYAGYAGVSKNGAFVVPEPDFVAAP